MTESQYIRYALQSPWNNHKIPKKHRAEFRRRESERMKYEAFRDSKSLTQIQSELHPIHAKLMSGEVLTEEELKQEAALVKSLNEKLKQIFGSRHEHLPHHPTS